MAYQLCLGDEPLSSVIDRITEAATRAVPAVDRAQCRTLIELIFRARVRQTTACGRSPECQPAAGLWPGPVRRADGPERSAGWCDLDPYAVPDMFGASAAAIADVAIEDRGALAHSLAAAFRSIVAPLLRFNPSCGRAELCRSTPTYPLQPREGAAMKGGSGR